MERSISVKPSERKTLMRCYRKPRDPVVGHRAHIPLRLDDGCPGSRITAMLYTSSSTIARWKRRFEQGGSKRS